jgi:hypothetical protein
LVPHQTQHSLSAAAATVGAAEGVVSTAAAVAVSTVGVGAFTVAVEASMVVGGAIMAADITVAGGRLVEEVTAKAAAFAVGQGLVFVERAAVLTAGLKRAAVLARAEIERRIFVRQSTMGSGIRSAAPVVPRV